MPKTFHKPHWFYDRVWGVNYYFYIDWSAKDFEREFKRQYGYKMRVKGAVGRCCEWYTKDMMGVVIWVAPRLRVNRIPVIVHECVHAAMFTLDKKGSKVSGDNHEHLTYLVQALVKEALSASAE